jgi:hypothetical protein
MATCNLPDAGRFELERDLLFRAPMMRGIIVGLIVLALVPVARAAPTARVQRVENVHDQFVAVLAGARNHVTSHAFDVSAFATHDRTRSELAVSVQVRVIVSDRTGKMLSVATASATASAAVRKSSAANLRDQATGAALRAVIDQLRVRRLIGRA